MNSGRLSNYYSFFGGIFFFSLLQIQSATSLIFMIPCQAASDGSGPQASEEQQSHSRLTMPSLPSTAQFCRKNWIAVVVLFTVGYLLHVPHQQRCLTLSLSSTFLPLFTSFHPFPNWGSVDQNTRRRKRTWCCAHFQDAAGFFWSKNESG